MSLILRDNTTVEDPRLDRLVNFDRRSRSFPIREVLPKTRKQRSYTWKNLTLLNQGVEGACVGFSLAHVLLSRRISKTLVGVPEARAIYKRAQQIDPWEGEDYEGTSVLAGVKAAMEYYPESIQQYRWCFSLEDVIDTIGYFGPVVFGLNWYQGMWDVNTDGFIKPTGMLVGGHAIEGKAVDVKNRRILLQNSWGSDWGIQSNPLLRGCAYISFDDLDRLLHEYGECVVPIRLPKNKR